MIKELLTDIDFWKYVSIPFVAAFVGWGTNWMAIKLLFYPVKPVGWPPYLGWWGILPSKAAKMGAITADTTTSKLGNLKDVFRSMEPERISDYLVQSIEPRVEDYVNWIMLEENSKTWDSLPRVVKSVVYAMVREKLPETIRKMMQDIGENIEDMVDLKHMVIKQLLKDRRIVNRIFLECGSEEFKFIIRSGIYFGFLFGMVQMGVWIIYKGWWILPLFGAIVGYATNWIALRIIFQPLEPKKIGPFVLQGLFLKRQKEVSNIWSGIITQEIITVKNIIDAMINGPKSEYTNLVIKKYIRDVVDRVVGFAKPMVQFTFGSKEYSKIKESASDKAIRLTPSTFNDAAFNRERAMLVKQMLTERMEALTSAEFQYLLRPAFQEDELKLIIMGAVLGLGAGIAQLFLIFGGG